MMGEEIPTEGLFVPSLPLPAPNSVPVVVILVNEEERDQKEHKKCQGGHQDMVLSLRIMEVVLAIPSLPPSRNPG